MANLVVTTKLEDGTKVVASPMKFRISVSLLHEAQ